MSSDLANAVNLILLGVLIATAIAAGISGAYITWVYRQRREQAVYLTLLVRRDQRIAVGGLLILVVGGYALLRFAFPDAGLPGLVAPWTTVVIVVAIELMLWGVIADALQMRRDRRIGRGR